MGTLLDASALIAFLLDEPAAEDVALLVREGDARITAVNLAEVVDRLVRVQGIDTGAVRRALELAAPAGITVSPVVEGHAWRAAAVRASHYERRRSELSLADCILLAGAEPGERVAASDPAVARVARREGLEVLPLQDSRGRRAG